jgi:3-phosphoshikimate 1-carboxyvinyltransferase
MTVKAVEEAGISFDRQGYTFKISGNQEYRAAEKLIVEKDWSSAAFPLCMGAFSEEGVKVTGLNMDSVQGDKEIVKILEGFGANVSVSIPESVSGNSEQSGKLATVTVRKGSLKGQVIDASRIPDLVPVISVVAAGAEGETRIIHAERLRIKESDRLATTTAMLKALGADIEETEDGLHIKGKTELTGGTVESFNDHRIAMSAAVAADICRSEVTVNGAECTDKSFPGFWGIIGK